METLPIFKLGFNEHFQNQYRAYSSTDLSPARVIEVNRNSFMVSDGLADMAAELSGKFLFETQSAIELPTVGDWVAIQPLNNRTFAIIHAVLPRQTVIKRKEAGKKIDFQLIGANIDVGLIMQPADQLNGNLLDRYLVMLNESGIQPITVISKIDLLDDGALAELQHQLETMNVHSIYMTTKRENGTDALSAILVPGKTYCLIGKSGVGKTSLINALLHHDRYQVNDIREKDGRGKHTTVRRQLICLESGSILIDTPGIRELGNFNIDSGLEQTFDDLFAHAKNCRFKNCTHTHEAGCAVLEAVTTGEIEEQKLRNYLKLKKESDFYEMSHFERRKKDKAFGKMVKSHKKTDRM